MRRNLLCIYNFLIKIYITYTTHAHRECVCVYWRGQWIYSIWVLWSEVCSVVCALLKWWNGRHTERVFVNYGANLKYFPTIVFQVSRIHSNFDGPVKTMTVTQYFIIFYGFAFFSQVLFFFHTWFYPFFVYIPFGINGVCYKCRYYFNGTVSLSLSHHPAGRQASSSAVVLHEPVDNSTEISDLHFFFHFQNFNRK